MAKDKKGKSDKAVAGVKIPKSVREAGAAAKEFAQQPVVSDLVVAALTAAATSLAQTQAAKAAGDATADAASETVEHASAIGAAVKRVLLDAARELLDNLDDAVESGEKTLARSAPDKPKSGSKPKGGKKKKKS